MAFCSQGGGEGNGGRNRDKREICKQMPRRKMACVDQLNVPWTDKCDYLIAVRSSKTVWELAINRGSLFPLFLCGRREGAWNLICLNKCVICKKFSHFNSISCLVFNTMFIIKYAPEFIYFCQAVGQLRLAMQTLFYVWIFLTVILCVNFLN